MSDGKTLMDDRDARKAEVVADYLSGKSKSQIAKERGISRTTVKAYLVGVDHATSLKLASNGQNGHSPDQCTDFWNAVEKLAISQVQSLTALNRLISNEEYASRQLPSELAELVRTAQECGNRLLGGLANLRANEQRSPELPTVVPKHDT